MSDKKLEFVARAAFEANKAYSLSIGDTSHKSWEDSDESFKRGYLTGVQKALDGCSPRQLHEEWLEAKLADGWKFGEVKNAETKEHPCCIGYHCLPDAQKTKDFLFVAVVQAMATAMGVGYRLTR